MDAEFFRTYLVGKLPRRSHISAFVLFLRVLLRAWTRCSDEHHYRHRLDRNVLSRRPLSRSFLLRSPTRKKGRRPPNRMESITIEHGEFLQALRRLRRELLKKPQGSKTSHKVNHEQSAVVCGGGPESATASSSSSLPMLNLHRDLPETMSRGENSAKYAKLQATLFQRKR